MDDDVRQLGQPGNGGLNCTAIESPGYSLTGVPWNIRDIISSVFFLSLSIIAVLATVQTIDSVRSGESGDVVASSAVSIALALLLIGAVARLSHLPIKATMAVTVATAGTATIVSLAADGSLTDSGNSVFGLPAAVFFIALVETILLITTLLYTRGKFGVPLRTLGLVRVSGVRSFATAGMYWVLALVAIGIWAVSMQAIGADEFLFPDTAEEALTLAGGSIPLAIALIGILGPIGEELFFRGFVLNGLRNRFGIKTSVVITSVFFGAVHVAPGAIIPTFFLGLAFALIYIRTRSLWPAIFAHSVQNTLAIIAAATNLAS